jgi:hypothetical protein
MPNIALPLASLSATLGSVSLALLAFLFASFPAFPLIFTTLLGIGGVICLIAAASCIDFAIDSLHENEIKEIGDRLYNNNPPATYTTASNSFYQIKLRLVLFGGGYAFVTLAIGTLAAILVITFFGPLVATNPAWRIVSYVFAAFWATMVIWKMMTLQSTPFPYVVMFGLGFTIAAFVFHWIAVV